MFEVPHDLRRRPVSRAELLASGVPRGVLQGRQFLRLHHGVYCFAGHAMTFQDRIAAARLALPPSAVTTGVTRLQEIGIDVGPRAPLHFVVEGDHHLAIDGVFLHRTLKMPPHEDGHASDEAVYVAYSATARLIDAIKVGCEMQRRGRLDLSLLDDLIDGERWRRGVRETAYVLPWLTDRCRSMPEAELLAYVRAAGLRDPEVNTQVEIAPGVVVTPDLWFAAHRSAAEYEGSQHQEDRAQYNADIDRYADYRRYDVAYELVTRERMRTPKATIRAIHAMLTSRGYAGPAPDFGDAWESLLRPLRELVRPRAPRVR